MADAMPEVAVDQIDPMSEPTLRPFGVPDALPAGRGGEQVLRAAVLISVFALIIGYIDNYVRVIAAEAGLWQFHAMRSAIILAMMAVCAPIFRWRIRPKNPRAVIARSLIHGTAMLCYFGALGFLPVAQVAAGLFTAPVFVLVIERVIYGERIGTMRIAAVAAGFAGIVLVLGPGGGADSLRIATVIPVIGAALYAMGNIATRRWCMAEDPATLTAAFFGTLGVFGLIGLGALAVWPQAVPMGTDGFILRGFVWPSAGVLWWTFVQAIGSLIGILCMMRAYQIAPASKVAVFEYIGLPAAAFWGWALWAQVPHIRDWLGMALIVLAGLLIVARSR
jgi:drug/metabolite transporter (DMT)-like permease